MDLYFVYIVIIHANMNRNFTSSQFVRYDRLATLLRISITTIWQYDESDI